MKQTGREEGGVHQFGPHGRVSTHPVFPLGPQCLYCDCLTTPTSPAVTIYCKPRASALARDETHDLDAAAARRVDRAHDVAIDQILGALHEQHLARPLCEDRLDLRL